MRCIGCFLAFRAFRIVVPAFFIGWNGSAGWTRDSAIGAGSTPLPLARLGLLVAAPSPTSTRHARCAAHTVTP